MSKRVLTGIKPTGVPHVGNVLGAIEPAIALTRKEGYEAFLFIADLHALTQRPDPNELRTQIHSVAATWLALGLDPERACFYRQSKIPQIAQLAWILSCSTSMGLLNRAHSFKDAVAKGKQDDEINHGLFAYPVLMAADILAFDANVVPVGRDQKQHLEIAQEAARRFNSRYGDALVIPEARIDDAVMTVPGLDGRKMSKSYDNTLRPFDADKRIAKQIKSIKTDSTEYGAPLPIEDDVILSLHGLLAGEAEHQRLRAQYASGRKDPAGGDDTNNYFGWGDAKKALASALSARFGAARETYEAFMADPDRLEMLLSSGEARARAHAQVVLDRVREAAGLP